MQTHREPWLCSSPAHSFPTTCLKACFYVGQCSADIHLDLKIFEEYFWVVCGMQRDMKLWHQNYIPPQWFYAGGRGSSLIKSPKGIMQVKSCCWRKQHQGVATPLLSNNYSLLMDCYGQLKSAVYPRFWINYVGSKSLSFWQHHLYILYLDANLSNPRSDNSVWTSVGRKMLRCM